METTVQVKQLITSIIYRYHGGRCRTARAALSAVAPSPVLTRYETRRTKSGRANFLFLIIPILYFFIPEGQTFQQTTMSVSYTHLDVYKRQILLRRTT